MIRGALLVAGVLVFLTACTPAPSPTEVWRNDTVSFGIPEVAGDTAVGYVVEERRLSLVGWSLADGQEVWRHAAYPSFAPVGFRIHPAATHTAQGDRAAYLTLGPPQAGGATYYAVALVDVATGETWLADGGAPIVPDRYLEVCEDDGASFCVEGRDVSGTGSGEWRVDATSGLVTWTADEAQGFEIGPDLRMEGGLLVHEEPRWTSTYEAVFGAGYTTAGGWRWELDDVSGLLIGSAARSDETEGYTDTDMTSDITVGIDPQDGRVVWSVSGVTTNCAGAHDRVDVWCRTVSGTWSGDPRDPEFQNLEAALEGFDAATGEVRWSIAEASPHAVLWGTEGTRFADADDTIVTESTSGAVRVTVSTGEVVPVAEGTTLMCLVDSAAEIASPARGEIHEYRGDPLIRPCDDHGQAVATLPDRATVQRAAVDAGEHGFLLATPEGLLLVR